MYLYIQHRRRRLDKKISTAPVGKISTHHEKAIRVYLGRQLYFIILDLTLSLLARLLLILFLINVCSVDKSNGQYIRLCAVAETETQTERCEN